MAAAARLFSCLLTAIGQLEKRSMLASVENSMKSQQVSMWFQFHLPRLDSMWSRCKVVRGINQIYFSILRAGNDNKEKLPATGAGEGEIKRGRDTECVCQCGVCVCAIKARESSRLNKY